ncbi:MAG: DUF924 domain-containing protein [Rhodobacteraceae bacterium]|nr:DUF924 domain-containing protein [Paracoccaceae bacterium]
MASPEEILKFWLDDVGPEGWYKVSDELDTQVREGFMDTWVAAQEGSFAQWLTYPSGALAYVVLNDQLPRNMFRGSSKAFSSDRIALAAAKGAIHQGYDLKIDEPARQFFYLPLMHSENLCDQERCVRLMKERMPEAGTSNMLHAKAHREVIRQFGRFPYRNEALARASTGPEKAYVENGGYGQTVQQLQQAG